MKLQRTYFVLRHGISTANERGLVVSRPEHGIADYGLSERGVEQCRIEFASLAARIKNGEYSELRRARVLSSDFRRARETAELFCEILGLSAPELDGRLRERNFGEIELQSHDRYAEIWSVDASDADARTHRSESANEVRVRILSLCADLEARSSDNAIVLVSHGDTLQILQTVFAALPAGAHRSLPHLKNAELRRLASAGPA
jgi:broad specificity phosphatase PhoE